MTLRHCAFVLAPALLLAQLVSVRAQQRTPVQGTKCARNQVVNKMTVYEDGAIEAECGPMPCGTAGADCADNLSSCRADSQLFSGMGWAPNGQSLLLRCCSYNVPQKIYVGTDLVTLGSYYTGGLVAKGEEMVGSGGREYDFVANARTEQGGVRVWVYRIVCPPQQQQQQQPQQQQQQQFAGSPQEQKRFDLAAIEAARQQTLAKNQAYEQRRQSLFKQISENRDAPAETVAAAAPARDYEQEAVNPLQYRPRQRDALPPQQRLL